MKKDKKSSLCPCGSGKPAGQCCYRDNKVVSLYQVRMRRAGQELRRKLGEFADQPAFSREAARAQEQYLSCISPDYADRDDDFIMERCFEWFIFDYVLPSGSTIIELFRDSQSFSGAEEELLADWTAARVSIYEAVRNLQDKGIVIRNLIDQSEIAVNDTTVAELVEEGAILLMRVLKVGNEYEFSTSGLALPGFCKLPLMRRLQDDLVRYCRQKGIPSSEAWQLYLRDRADKINGWVMDLGISASMPHLVDEDFSEPFMPDIHVQNPSLIDKLSARIAQRITDAFLDEYYDKWVDQSIPALGNKTPRDACRTEKGRSRVEELLRELERVEKSRAHKGEPYYDIDRVRKKLGLKKNTPVVSVMPGPNKSDAEQAGTVKWEKGPGDYKWPHPAQGRVASMVIKSLTARHYEDRQVDGAIHLWYDYCCKENPKLRKEAVWVASVIYTMARLELDEEINQQELANEFGVGASTISANFRSICRSLELAVFDRRYSTQMPPLDQLDTSDPLLAQILDNLKL